MGLSTLAWLCCVLAGYQVLSAAIPEPENTAINGDYILDLGNAFNESLLQLVGKVFVNFERNMSRFVNQTRAQHFVRKMCEAKECDEWPEWPKCPAASGQFAWVTRERQCGQNTTHCTYAFGKARTEKDTKICVGEEGTLDLDLEEEDGEEKEEYYYDESEYNEDDVFWDEFFGFN